MMEILELKVGSILHIMGLMKITESFIATEAIPLRF